MSFKLIATTALLTATISCGHAFGLSTPPAADNASAKAPLLVFQTDPNMPPAEAWTKVDLANWQTKTARDLMGVFRPLFAGFAEFDGARATAIGIRPAPGGQIYEVFITQDGLADDSVSAMRWAAKVKPGSEGWTLQGLWRQQRCARGANKGQWTKANCL